MQSRTEQDFIQFLHDHSQFSNYLDDKSKLAMRLTSKKLQSYLHEHIQGPYYSKADFVIGVENTFYHPLALAIAWESYARTISSTSLLPAMVYKLINNENIKTTPEFIRFTNSEDLEMTGRKYDPIDVHAWDINQVWVLAQIHKQRSFVVFSEIRTKFFFRAKTTHLFSAYAKEMASAMKAGYTIHCPSENRLTFIPDPMQDYNKMTLRDLTLTDDDILSTIAAVTQADHIKSSAKLIGRYFKVMFEALEYEVYPIDKPIYSETIATSLEAQQAQLEALFSLYYDPFFLICENKTLAIAMFQKEFNLNKPEHFPQIDLENSSTRFFGADKAEQIKKIILNAYDKRCKQLLAIVAEENKRSSYRSKRRK